MSRKIEIESHVLGSGEIERDPVEISEEEEAFFAKIRDILAELPESDDLIILTLKGHLIIEQMIVHMIEVSVPNTDALRPLDRLPFHQRAALAYSFLLPELAEGNSASRGIAGMWQLVKQIGRIRNRVAHNLRVEDLEEDVEKYIESYVEVFGPRIKEPIPEELKPYVIKTNIMIPTKLRQGSIADRYRYCLAATAQSLAGVLAVLKSDAESAISAIRETRKP